MQTKRLAAPFLTTFALACTRSDPGGAGTKPPITADSVDAAATPATSDTAGAAASSSAGAVGVLTFDGFSSCYRTLPGSDEKKYEPCTDDVLPKPKPGDATYKDGAHCKLVPNGALVACPPGGAPIVLPETTDDGLVGLRTDSLTCIQFSVAKTCPPGIHCNPPPPKTVPCPPALLPKLAPGVKPTKVDGTHCEYSGVVVKCP